MSQPANRPDIELIKELAKRAGEEILRIYRSTDPALDWNVQTKSDESPLTQADLRANEIIVAGLTALSNLPIISEEGEAPLVETHRAFWLVDPLDGTRDFVARKDTFVVCIALIENNEPTLGVLYSPVTGETWWAEKGRGAFNDRGRLQNRRENTTGLIAIGSRSMPSDRMQVLYDKYGVTHVERFGSALKFCKMAEGLYDLYPRFGPMMEWDTAAGQILVEEAGCQVLDINTGTSLRYGKPGLANRGFLCSRANLQLELPKPKS